MLTATIPLCLMIVGQLAQGDILLTRNWDKRDNTTPGYWNHAAVYIGNDKVVESQVRQGVIVTSLDVFWARYPRIRVVRPLKQTLMTAERMTRMANQFRGVKYRKIATIGPRLKRYRRSENCVSLVRKCYFAGFGFDPRWKRPDDLASDGRLRMVIEKDQVDRR